jgi:ParB family chromosome partitioning protein
VKVLQVRDAAGERAEIALHRQVTVVRGLDPLRRSWLLETLGALGANRPPAASGELVAHGITFPLDRESLALLDLEDPVDTIVRASDLPGHDPRIAEAVAARDRAMVRRRELTDQITRQREALAAAVAARADALAELDELDRGDGAAREALAAAEAARARLEAELASAVDERARNLEALTAAVLARDVASEARAAAAERLERARERRRDAMARATAAAAAVEQARPLVADDPTDELVARRAELAAAEAAASEADPDADSSPVSRRLAALERRRVELVRLREALGAESSSPVADALERLEGAGSEAAPVVAALALADTWRDLHQQVQALDAGVSEAEREAERRVAEARQSVIEAEVEYNQPVLTPEQITKVEAAHAAVLEAQDRTEGRFGGSRLRKKLEDARNEERRVLERLGFSTYADYMMSSSSRGVGPANRAVLETARANLKGAEDALAALPGAADRARRRAELLQRRDAVSPKVAALIGHEPTGPEAEDELRSLREPVAPDEAAMEGLAEELRAVGVSVDVAPYDRDDLVLLARFYLTEHHEASARRRDLEGALAAVDGQVAALRSAHDRGQQELPHLEPLPPMAEPGTDDGAADGADAEAQARTLREARWAEVEAARTAVTDAEVAVARHREASDGLARLEAELASVGIEEEQAAASVAEAEADVALANGPAFDEAVAAATEAESALARSTAREDEAQRALVTFDAEAGVGSLRTAAQARATAAEQAVTEAAAAEQVTAGSLAEVDAAFAAATAAEQQAHAEAEALDRGQLLDDLDWQLLARLATVRSVGLAGSLPLVLDDPFAILDDDELGRVLDRLGRMADAVQIVLVTEREAAVAWAAQAGSERALVVSG